MSFSLDKQLEKDTEAVCDLALCSVRLMRDARFPWLVLIPRKDTVVEFTDLSQDDQHQLMQEVACASRVLQSSYNPDKMNIAMLGNMVRQLHVHVVARFQSDDAWPKPIWGIGTARAYEISELGRTVKDLVQRFDRRGE